MEKLVQKYIKYLYIILFVVILIQLVIVASEAIALGLHYDSLLFMIFSAINIMLLFDGIKHNHKQQFTECKFDAKILRYTIGLLMGTHMLLYFKDGFNWVAFFDHILITSATILMLNFRIKTIEQLEDMANHFIKNNVISPKKKEGE